MNINTTNARNSVASFRGRFFIPANQPLPAEIKKIVKRDLKIENEFRYKAGILHHSLLTNNADEKGTSGKGVFLPTDLKENDVVLAHVLSLSTGSTGIERKIGLDKKIKEILKGENNSYAYLYGTKKGKIETECSDSLMQMMMKYLLNCTSKQITYQG